MSLLFRQRRDFPGATAAQLIPPRSPIRSGTAYVSNESAMKHSAVWACLRLRGDLISTMPIDVFRRVAGIQVQAFKPPILINPGGDRVGIQEWMYSTQVDLDRAGNAFGIITQRDGRGLPARIDLVAVDQVTVKVRDGKIWRYRIEQTDYDPADIWHEKQFTVAGLHIGLSPVMNAAYSIGEYMSVQQFALDWFGNGPVPSGHLKNTELTITADQADEIKGRFVSSVKQAGLFVTGKDWDYQMVQVGQAQANWIEAKEYGIVDVARFFGVPADLIDGSRQKGTITYANVTQHNLQFLVMHLGPAIRRREDALTALTPAPQYVKLNADALLRMDPQMRAQTLQTRIDSRTLAPSEARELENLPPLTDAQYTEFDRLFGSKNPPPAKTTTPPPQGAPQ